MKTKAFFFFVFFSKDINFEINEKGVDLQSNYKYIIKVYKGIA